MGILDKKTRFIDLVVTQEGKRQIAAGNLRAEFASLSDSNVFYDKGERDSVNQRIYFEVMERPENAIVLEKDDSGQIFNLNMSPTGSIIGNNIFIKDTTVATELSLMVATSSLDFTLAMDSVLDSSLRHFQKNYFIGTDDLVGDNEFETDKENITFRINNTQPFLGSPRGEIININDAEPFFLDAKLAHLPNFQYLPPQIDSTGGLLGEYEDIRSTSRQTWEDILRLVGPEEYMTKESLESNKRSNDNLKDDMAGERGYLSQKLLVQGKLPIPREPTRSVETINFTKNSYDSNILLQIYEDSIGPEMNKLDIIDAGVFNYEKDANKRYEKRVFYVGKVFYDDFKIPTFVNIFTLIMD